MRYLCHRLHIADERKVTFAFREYRDTSTTTSVDAIPHDLQPLKQAIDTLAVSTAECERSFSVMNDTLTPIRNSLSVSRLSSLILIKCVGPPLPLFKPVAYVSSWLAKGRRSAVETQ